MKCSKIGKLISHFGLIVVFLASFGDEVASFIFSFKQVDSESMLKLSLLMMCPLLGGVLSAPLSISLLNRYQPRRLLGMVFIGCGLTCLMAAFSRITFTDYIAAFVLGGLGSMLWSSLNVLIANTFSERELPGINQITQSIRNAGYIVAPMVAGVVSEKFNVGVMLLSVAVLFGLSVALIPAIFDGRRGNVTETPSKKETFFNYPKVAEFLKIPRMAAAILPLTVTILTTSVFNVAFIHYILIDNSMSKADYGLIVSGISIGLVIGPLFLRIFRNKKDFDHAVVACLAAATIGLCVGLSGLLIKPTFLFLTLLCLGIANSIQNVSMSTLTMKLVPKERRTVLMPTYMFIIQACVLTGFLTAGFVPTKFSAFVLILGGAVAALAGFAGAAVNSRAPEGRHA